MRLDAAQIGRKTGTNLGPTQLIALGPQFALPRLFSAHMSPGPLASGRTMGSVSLLLLLAAAAERAAAGSGEQIAAAGRPVGAAQISDSNAPERNSSAPTSVRATGYAGQRGPGELAGGQAGGLAGELAGGAAETRDVLLFRGLRARRRRRRSFAPLDRPQLSNSIQAWRRKFKPSQTKPNPRRQPSRRKSIYLFANRAPQTGRQIPPAEPAPLAGRPAGHSQWDQPSDSRGHTLASSRALLSASVRAFGAPPMPAGQVEPAGQPACLAASIRG